MQSLEHLLFIDKNFQTAVNLRLDRKDLQKFLNYIPTASSMYLLNKLLQTVLERKGNRASILIGPYGKGKSHLLLVLLALLEKQYPEQQNHLLKRLETVNRDCTDTAKKVIEKGKYLTVLVSESGYGLNHAFLLALKEALEGKNLQALMPDSYYSEALKVLKRWKEKFPQTYYVFEEYLCQTENFHKVPEAMELFQSQLESFQEEALKLFQKIYPYLTSGMEFQPLINMEAVLLYQEVNRKLCSQYGYCGIYVVFDEFSKYVEGHSGEGFALDMKILQDFCELANAKQEEDFFITFVAHKSLREYNKKFPKEMQNQFRGVEGRLFEYLFVASERNHFDLIRNVLCKTERFYTEYPAFVQKKEVAELLEKSYKLPVFQTQFSWEEYLDIVAKGCFPLTPMTVVLLLYLCEKIAQNERTLFTFLANDEYNSLYSIVHNKRRNAGQYLGADILYDYFSPALRDSGNSLELHNEWLKAEYALKQIEDVNSKKVIKVIAILFIAGNRQEFPVQYTNIALAAGMTVEEVQETVQVLINQQLLLWRGKLGCFAFKNNIGINLEAEAEEVVKKLSPRLDITKELAELSELKYILPKSYNQKYTITRYFQYVYMTKNVFEHLETPQYLFQEEFSDGKIIALVDEQVIEEKIVLKKTQEWNDSRVVVLLPKRSFSQRDNIRRILALRTLLENKEFIEENKAVQQEIKLYIDDLLFELNTALEQDFLPEQQRCRVFWQGKQYEFFKEKEFNSFLSEICGIYYEFSPKVNHELLNIQNVTGQYLKARNHIVEDILQEVVIREKIEKEVSAEPFGFLANYRKGTSPEAMIYRTAIIRTGLAGQKYDLDIGTEKTRQEIRNFILSSTEQKKSFLELYTKLQGRGYGVRKGILPIFLAIELTSVVGSVILYLQSKEISCTYDVLNNINEKPEQYFLYVETGSNQKEQYLTVLEDFFQIPFRQISGQKRLLQVVETMQKQYRSLPKVVSNWKEYQEEDWKQVIFDYRQKNSQDCFWTEEHAQQIYQASLKFMQLLRRLEINPHEILFEKIPQILFRPEADLFSAQAIEIIFLFWRKQIVILKGRLIQQCLLLWGGSSEESISVYLKEWYKKYSVCIKNKVLSSAADRLMSYLEGLQNCDNIQVIEEIAFLINHIYIEDWFPKSQEDFIEALSKAKQEIEQLANEKETSHGRKILFTDKKGNLIEKYFQAEESGIGDFLKNAMEEAMEEFGSSLEPEEKIAVLVEMLEKVLT